MHMKFSALGRNADFSSLSCHQLCSSVQGGLRKLATQTGTPHPF